MGWFSSPPPKDFLIACKKCADNELRHCDFCRGFRCYFARKDVCETCKGLKIVLLEKTNYDYVTVRPEERYPNGELRQNGESKRVLYTLPKVRIVCRTCEGVGFRITGTGSPRMHKSETDRNGKKIHTCSACPHCDGKGNKRGKPDDWNWDPCLLCNAKGRVERAKALCCDCFGQGKIITTEHQQIKEIIKRPAVMWPYNGGLRVPPVRKFSIETVREIRKECLRCRGNGSYDIAVTLCKWE